jgi:hypothetical protein
MSRTLTIFYLHPDPQAEKQLRKSNPAQEGGLVETSWLVTCVSTSFRTSSFLSERDKFEPPQLWEPVARDIVRRRWIRKRQDIHNRRDRATHKSDGGKLEQTPSGHHVGASEEVLL